MSQLTSAQEHFVHVRFEGQSWDIAFSILDLGDFSSDQDVRQALANYLQVPLGKFASYIVQRHANGNITLRPEAVFG
jgi:hypothetical protein